MRHSKQLRAQVLEALAVGKTRKDAGSEFRVAQSTIALWKKQEASKRTKTAPTTVTTNGASRLSLEEFVNMLHSLTSEYERIQNRLRDLERSVERWKVIAGDLNAKMNK